MSEPRRYTRAEGYNERELLLAGSDHLEASAHLFASLDVRLRFVFLDSAGYLACLGLELVFKAALLHSHDEFPGTHDLVELANAFQTAMTWKLDDEQMNFLRRLDSFQHLRYPNPRKPVRIETGDIARVAELLEAIVNVFPPALRNTYLSMRDFDEEGHQTKGGRVVMIKPIKP